jgi:hypothetical protein
MSRQPILVEKHYIPEDVYIRLYGGGEQNVPAAVHNMAESANRIPWLLTQTRGPEPQSQGPEPQSQGPEPQTRRPTVISSRSYRTTNASPEVLTTLMSAFFNMSNLPNMEQYQTTDGLTRREIDMNSRIINYTDAVDLDSSSCPICTVDWQHGDTLRKLNMCRHYFHKDCIDTWLADHDTCPMCRARIIPPDINEVD